MYIPAKLKEWQLVSADFKEFPERDLVNFPYPNKPAYPSKVRLGVIPDSWFRFFYDKTGETGELEKSRSHKMKYRVLQKLHDQIVGGYLFMGGLATTLFSTETLILDVEFFTPIPHIGNMFLITLVSCF